MLNELHSEMTKTVNEHRETYDEDKMRDLIDVYIRQIRTSGDPGFTGHLILLHCYLLVKYLSI